MSRPTDQMHITRSYTVQWNNLKHKYEVVPSSWIPGYTPAHCATPAEALEHAINTMRANLDRMSEQLQQLHEVEYQEVPC